VYLLKQLSTAVRYELPNNMPALMNILSRGRATHIPTISDDCMKRMNNCIEKMEAKKTREIDWLNESHIRVTRPSEHPPLAPAPPTHVTNTILAGVTVPHRPASEYTIVYSDDVQQPSTSSALVQPIQQKHETNNAHSLLQYADHQTLVENQRIDNVENGCAHLIKRDLSFEDSGVVTESEIGDTSRRSIPAT
jgi:hypothetical protein